MPVAEFTLGDALLTVVEIFVFVIYFWILITIFGDLFRDHQLSGWAKAGWVLVLFLVPFLGMLIYLIARGEACESARSGSRRTCAGIWTPISARPPEVARRPTSFTS